MCHHGEAVLVGEDDVYDGATAAAVFLLTPPGECGEGEGGREGETIIG